VPNRVILADDNPEILKIALSVLEPHFSVAGMYLDGASAIREGLMLEPDVAVLDVSLGPVSGFEIARQIRELRPSAHIVFLSVHEQPEFIEAGRKAGADAYVFKRCIYHDLVNAVRGSIDHHCFCSSSCWPSSQGDSLPFSSSR
jgi:DNA-binding NarL/FixJ family response regulator